MAKIKPTVGRVVHYHGNSAAGVQAALIAYVHSDTMLNLGVFDENGVSYGATSVPLVQDGEEIPVGGHYATWMPYQVGQAVKTEHLEKKLAERTGDSAVNVGDDQQEAPPADPAPAESEVGHDG